MIVNGKNYAENIGVIGEVYPIAEEDFLTFIKNRITLIQKSGEWQLLENQFKENVKKHILRPTPIQTITHASTTRSWNYDPSITIPYDLKDATGRIITPAGTTVNPLKAISLSKILIFFDGDDEKEKAWVKKVDEGYHGKTKLILINGSISDNEKYFQKPIYFDQQGKLVNKFNIQHVPAIVQQNGLMLKISEVSI
jgi:conjugal transfer pilus assembly protein TraW